MNYHPAPLGDWLAELRDPWPVIDRLRMALNEARRYTLGDTNCTGLSIDSLLQLLPREEDYEDGLEDDMEDEYE